MLAFFTSLIAFTLLFAWMLALRVRLGRTTEVVEELELRHAGGSVRSSGISTEPSLGSLR